MDSLAFLLFCELTPRKSKNIGSSFNDNRFRKRERPSRFNSTPKRTIESGAAISCKIDCTITRWIMGVALRCFWRLWAYALSISIYSEFFLLHAHFSQSSFPSKGSLGSRSRTSGSISFSVRNWLGIRCYSIQVFLSYCLYCRTYLPNSRIPSKGGRGVV